MRATVVSSDLMYVMSLATAMPAECQPRSRPHFFLHRYSFPGLSWNSLCGKFMIFTTDAEISRRVFTYNDPETLLMAVHPSGKNILGEGNLAFMHGPPHKAIRKSFLSLFTRKALATYVELQDGIIREHLQQWQQVEGEREIRLFVRYVCPAAGRCNISSMNCLLYCSLWKCRKLSCCNSFQLM